MTLQSEQVNTLLGLDILNDSYKGVGYRRTQAGAPRGGVPWLTCFYRWTGKNLAMASWRFSIESGISNPTVGRSYFALKICTLVTIMNAQEES